jgi:hypothetical protein
MNTAGAVSRGGPRTAAELAEQPDEGSRFDGDVLPGLPMPTRELFE